MSELQYQALGDVRKVTLTSCDHDLCLEQVTLTYDLGLEQVILTSDLYQELVTLTYFFADPWNPRQEI
jgi:hypothetical protein